MIGWLKAFLGALLALSALAALGLLVGAWPDGIVWIALGIIAAFFLFFATLFLHDSFKEGSR